MPFRACNTPRPLFLSIARLSIQYTLNSGTIPMPRRLFPALLAAASILAQTQFQPGCLLAAQSPQQPSPHQSDAQARIRVNSDLVVLPVTVKDSKGDLVPDLQQKDFRIFDDNVEQAIDVFTAEAFPLSLLVLIDDDLKSKDAEQMTASLRAIIGGISANDEALICRFDLSFYPGDGFTSDLDKLWTALKEAQDYTSPSTAGPVPFVTPPSTHAAGVGEPRPKAPVNLGARATKALDDAVHYAGELLHDRGTARRKMILVISDGANAPLLNHYTYTDTLEALLRDNISVYSLAVGKTLSKQKFSRLRNYADDTGGDIYYADKSNSMERLYSQITEEARHEYTLAYVPRGTHHRSAYHAVEVRTTRDAVTVKTRQGYFTAPPAEPTN
jgi:Ca-activated chloride channel family protein